MEEAIRNVAFRIGAGSVPQERKTHTHEHVAENVGTIKKNKTARKDGRR